MSDLPAYDPNAYDPGPWDSDHEPRTEAKRHLSLAPPAGAVRTAANVETPVLLVGAERSGTTLLRLMLDSHPEISFGEEFEYAVSHIDEDGSFPSIEDFAKEMEIDRIFQQSGFEIDPDLDYRALICGFLEKRVARKDAAVVGATIHFDYLKALHIWPEATFIHLLRDPRDVARSAVNMGWAGNVWFGLDKWIEGDNAFRKLQERVAPEQILPVHFADLMADHEEVLETICEFVGVDYTSEMMSYAATTDYDVPDPTKAKSWRDDMSSLDIKLVETRLGDRLTNTGFEPSGLSTIPENSLTSRVMPSALKMHSRAGRIQNRVNRYGTKLTAEEMVARLTGNESNHRRALKKINEIDGTHLRKSWSDAAANRSSR